MAWRKRSLRYGVVAAAAIVVLAVVGLWPADPHNAQDSWWLAPPSAWAQPLQQALQTVKAVTWREQAITVASDGSHHTSSSWDKLYVSADSYRRDIYDGDVLREVQWYVPEAGDMIQTGLRYDLHSYSSVRHRGSYGLEDPIDRMRFYVGLLDKADRVLGTQSIEGRPCVGFEIRASQYGDNPDT